MQYVAKHWRGELSLGLSFWGNLVVPHALLWLLLWLLLHLYEDKTALSVRPDILALLFSGMVAAFISILIWQAVGMVRSAQFHKKRTGQKRTALAAQGIAVLIIVQYLPVFSVIPYRYFIGTAMVAIGMAPPPFEPANVSLCPSHAAIKVEGAFAYGLSGEIRRLLARYPNLDTIVLSGPGGMAYEARALHGVIADRALTTIVVGSCSSACAVAFLGGQKRIIGENARLGFHAVGPHVWESGLVDFEGQNRAIKSLFEIQDIDAEFIETVFATPSDLIWHPSFQELLDSSVVHAFIDSASLLGLWSGYCSRVR